MSLVPKSVRSVPLFAAIVAALAPVARSEELPYRVREVSRSIHPGAIRETQEFVFEIENRGSAPLVVQTARMSDEKCKTVFPQPMILPRKKDLVVVKCERLPEGVNSKELMIQMIEARPGARPLIERRILSFESKSKEDRRDSDCKSVNLHEPGGSMEKLAFGQQAFGTCAYNSAALLFDAERLREGGSRDPWNLTSELSVAYTLKKRAGARDLENGVVFDALKELLENGGCRRVPLSEVRESLGYRAWNEKQKEEAYGSDSHLGTEARKSRPKAKSEAKSPRETEESQDEHALFSRASWDEKPELGSEFLLFVRRLLDRQAKAKAAASGPAQRDSIDAVRTHEFCAALGAYGITPKGAPESLLRLYENREYLRFVEETLDLECAENRRVRLEGRHRVESWSNLDFYRETAGKKWQESPLESKITRKSNAQEIRRLIQARLDEGRSARPIAASFCLKSLLAKKSYPREGGDCDSHGAVIVARVKRAGKCFVQVQSAGASHWVALDDLISNLTNVTWLE